MKIILFELNEVPKKLIDDYMLHNPNSSISTLVSHSSYAQTYAVDSGELSPWVTWPTVHRGVANVKHGIKHLGQPLSEVNQEFPPLWDLATQAGAKVGVFGSLHTFPPPLLNKESYAFYLPDTFSPDDEAFPNELMKFQKFNLFMARESFRNVSTNLNIKKVLSLLPYLNSLGFSTKTAQHIIGQIIQERVNPKIKVRRRTIQSILAFDAFMVQLKRHKPDLSTFFTNHVASAMHRFWGAKFPGDFDNFGYDDIWIKSFNSEIDYTLDIVDLMLGRLKQFVNENSEFSLIITGSMGQDAASGAPVFSELIINNPEKLFSKIGLAKVPFKRTPAMNPDYSFEFEYDKSFLLNSLKPLCIIHKGGKHEIKFDFQDKFLHISLGFNNLNNDVDKVEIGGEIYSFEEVGLSIMDTDFNQGCTGYHIPQGIYIRYSSLMRSSLINTPIPTTSIAPNILGLLGIKQPDYMNPDHSLY